ncbi:hypothetical protein IID22_05235, partial [Patescibacteria group bacterium]|nr:hypothetical protein [Patescibacteria group bacterium]
MFACSLVLFELFSDEAEEAANVLKRQLEINHLVFDGIRSLFYASDHVNFREFEIFTANIIERY